MALIDLTAVVSGVVIALSSLALLWICFGDDETLTEVLEENDEHSI